MVKTYQVIMLNNEDKLKGIELIGNDKAIDHVGSDFLILNEGCKKATYSLKVVRHGDNIQMQLVLLGKNVRGGQQIIRNSLPKTLTIREFISIGIYTVKQANGGALAYDPMLDGLTDSVIGEFLGAISDTLIDYGSAAFINSAPRYKYNLPLTYLKQISQDERRQLALLTAMPDLAQGIIRFNLTYEAG